MVPVDVVHLDLAEIEMVFLVQFHQLHESLFVSVEREAEFADVAQPAFLHQEIHHPVVAEAAVEGGFVGQRVQQVVVNVVRAEILQRVPVHLDRQFVGRNRADVRQLGGDEIAVARIALQGFSGRGLALPLQVHGGGVEVVDSAGDRQVDHLVHLFLVDDLAAFGVAGHRPAHAAVAQQADTVDMGGHLAGDGGGLFLIVGGAGGQPQGCRSRARCLQKISSVHNPNVSGVR